MSDPLYREIILEHWKNPQNYGVIPHADIDITDYNPLCGDEIHITAKVKNEKITEIKFESEGCAISTASGSFFTEFVKNKKIDEIKKISSEDYLETLEMSLTAARIKCALLSYSAFQKALKK